MKQVSGDWKTSKVAAAISFSQTKIIQSQASLVELLDCIDKIGFAVACLNGTELCTWKQNQYSPESAI